MPLVTERNRKWWVVIAMALTTLLMTIDFNGLTVALPTIGRDLDTSTTGLQWTINAYLLALPPPQSPPGRAAPARPRAVRGPCTATWWPWRLRQSQPGASRTSSVGAGCC